MNKRLMAAALASLAVAACVKRQPSPPVEEAPVEVVVVDDKPQDEPRPEQGADQVPLYLLLSSLTSSAKTDAAFQAHGFRVPRAEYNAGLTEFLDGRPLTSQIEEEYRAALEQELLILRWLRDGGMTAEGSFYSESRQHLRSELARFALEQETEVTVTDDEARALYQERIDQYRQPERVHVRIILLPTAEEAEEVLAMLNDGQPFGSLAMEFSRHENRRNQGELDPFARGEYNRDFEEKAFALRPGEVGILNSAGGSFVMEKIANLPSTTVPFEDVRDGLRAELLTRKRAEKTRAVLQSIRSAVEARNDGSAP
jgi:hypothetical protein